MNAGWLNIGSRTAADRSETLREVLRRVARGDRMAREPGFYCESVEELRRILTEERLELLLAITRHRPAVVHQLAGAVGRDYKNVSTDVALLERPGWVTSETRAGKGRAQAPTVPYDEIHVTIDLRQPHEIHAV